MRILWISDRITGYSAYSKVTNECCYRLQKMGHQVAHVPMGRANRMGRYYDRGILIYNSGENQWAEDVAIRHYVDWKADMLISLKEPWVFNRINRSAINFVPMAVIDHAPVSNSITSRLRTAFKVIAISRHGQRELRRKKIESTYIPHAINCNTFKPLPEKERKRCRQLFHFDTDEFVVLVVAMNRARKTVDRMLRGYKMFRENNPDVGGHLMLWTDVRPSLRPENSPLGVSDVGVSLFPEIMELGMGEMVRWPEARAIKTRIPDDAGPDHPNEWDMNKLYNCANVLLQCTGGEGFGLPLIEAQATGCPVVTTDYAAGPEQVGSGLTVPWSDYIDITTPGTRYALCDIDRMADALEKIMNADPEKLSKRARSFAEERYNYPVVMDRYWKPFLEEASTELFPRVTSEGVKTWS